MFPGDRRIGCPYNTRRTRGQIAPGPGTAIRAQTITSLNPSSTTAGGPAFTVAAANQTLTFTYQAGAANPAPQNVPLTSTGGAVSLSAEAFSDENWLAVSPSSGTTPVTFSCSVNPAGLAPRTDSGLMFVTDTTTATVFVVGIRVPFRRVTPDTNFEGIIREYKQN